MSRKIVVATLLFAMLFSLSACRQQAKEETIKIGFFGALSGDQAVWGQADRDGVILTVEQINAAGGILGKKVELVVYDDKGDQLEAVNVVKRLINEDKVVAIIGCNSSGRNIAVAPVAEAGKVPVISTFATNPRVTVPEPGKLMKYTFRVCFIDSYSGYVKAKFAWDDLGARRAAVLYEISSDYSVGVRDFFKQSWAELGGELVADEAFKSGDVDFRPQLTKIKEANPDVIIMPFLYKEVALSTRQARDLGITATFLGGDGWPSSALLEMAADAVEGSYFVNHGDINAPNVQEWREQYKKRFNKDIEINSIMGHDAMIMLKAAIEKAGKAEPEAIRDALENLKGVEVFTGVINIDPATHNPVGKAASIIAIRNGQFQFYKQFEPMK
ncbi:MAG: ABC transporter substrate-binding protein [Chloroflexi bacterium]|nr:ABC transporter substrate-binding protein [Chloroflexota bacterium]